MSVITKTTSLSALKVCMTFLLFYVFSSGSNYAFSKTLNLYISPEGNDSWSGRKENKNNNGTDGPFTTLTRAQKEIRKLIKSGDVPVGGINVKIKKGTYPIENTFELGPLDSGTKESPIIWTSSKGGKVSFIGGKIVSGIKPVIDKDIYDRINEKCRKSICVIDLFSQGLTNLGSIGTGGWTKSHIGMELFYRGEPLTIARYPDFGWLKIADVPQTGEKVINEGDKWAIVDSLPAGRHYGRFVCGDERMKTWKPVGDIYMHGYWVWDWADEIQKVGRIDKFTGEIYPCEPFNNYGFRKNQRFYFFNLPEEMDKPGEYYIDRVKGMLYFYPPGEILDGDLFVSTLDSTMIRLKNASFITFRGITFEGARGKAIVIDGGSDIKIAGCVIRNFQDDAVTIVSGTDNGVQSCEIYNVEGGIILGGGDRKTLKPAGNYADNNDIHHYSRINRTYKPAVNLSGVGNRVTHNHIHHAPHAGIIFVGNEHRLEYNELDNIALETGDVGAFYGGYDWTNRGNTIKYNYFHNIHGPGWFGCIMVYQDLPGSGALIYGNVMYDVDIGFHTNSGRDNIIENNIFIKCNPCISFNIWRQPHMFLEGGDWKIFENLNAMNYKKPPYSVKYPELLSLFEDGDPAIPRGNKIMRNISYGGKFFHMHDAALDFELLSVRDNVIADSVIVAKRNNEKNTDDVFRPGDRGLTDELRKYGNIIIAGNPGFANIPKKDFRIKKNSAADKIGFKPIPFEKIGRYKDSYAESLNKIR